MRAITYENLDAGVLAGIIHTIKYLLDKRATIEWNSIETYNDMLKAKEEISGKEV